MENAKLTLYFKGVPPECREEEVKEFFARFGEIKSFYLKKGKEEPEPLIHYGFVSYPTPEVASTALSLAKVNSLRRRKLEIN